MNIDPKDGTLIEKYIEQAMTPNEKTDFEERLSNNTELLKTVFMAKLVSAIFKHPKGQQYQQQQRWQNTTTIELPYPTSIATYTPDEIKAMFAPLEHLEGASATRNNSGGGIQQQQSLLGQHIIAPPNNTKVVNKPVQFVLNQPINYALTLIVVNNIEVLQFTQTIPPNTLVFDVDTTNLKPGRYYWHLRLATDTPSATRRQYGSAYGSFLVMGNLPL